MSYDAINAIYGPWQYGGNLYVALLDDAYTFYIAKSTNGGLSWTKPDYVNRPTRSTIPSPIPGYSENMVAKYKWDWSVRRFGDEILIGATDIAYYSNDYLAKAGQIVTGWTDDPIYEMGWVKIYKFDLATDTYSSIATNHPADVTEITELIPTWPLTGVLPEGGQHSFIVLKPTLAPNDIWVITTRAYDTYYRCEIWIWRNGDWLHYTEDDSDYFQLAYSNGMFTPGFNPQNFRRFPHPWCVHAFSNWTHATYEDDSGYLHFFQVHIEGLRSHGGQLVSDVKTRHYQFNPAASLWATNGIYTDRIDLSWYPNETSLLGFPIRMTYNGEDRLFVPILMSTNLGLNYLRCQVGLYNPSGDVQNKWLWATHGIAYTALNNPGAFMLNEGGIPTLYYNEETTPEGYIWRRRWNGTGFNTAEYVAFQSVIDLDPFLSTYCSLLVLEIFDIEISVADQMIMDDAVPSTKVTVINPPGPEPPDTFIPPPPCDNVDSAYCTDWKIVDDGIDLAVNSSRCSGWKTPDETEACE